MGPSPQIIEVSENTPKPNDFRLYHYTTYNSFFSILNSKCLWASSHLSMNDNQEIIYAANCIFDYFLEAEKRDPELFNANFKRACLEAIVPNLEQDIFLVSLSYHAVSLSQFRAYAQPLGLSFGISIYTIVQLDRELGSISGKVIYNQQLQKTIIAKFLTQFAQEFQIANKANRDPSIFKNRILQEFRKLAPFLKHPAFSEEAEFRVVILPEHCEIETKSRPIGSNSVNYVEWPFLDRSAIGRAPEIPDIFVGPILDIGYMVRQVKDIVRDFGINNPTVISCDIPFEARHKDFDDIIENIKAHLNTVKPQIFDDPKRVLQQEFPPEIPKDFAYSIGAFLCLWLSSKSFLLPHVQTKIDGAKGHEEDMVRTYKICGGMLADHMITPDGLEFLRKNVTSKYSLIGWHFARAFKIDPVNLPQFLPAPTEENYATFCSMMDRQLEEHIRKQTFLKSLKTPFGSCCTTTENK